MPLRILYVLAITGILSLFCSCFESNDMGVSCCCVVDTGNNGKNYWTHSDACGGSTIGCVAPPDGNNYCGQRATPSSSPSPTSKGGFDFELQASLSEPILAPTHTGLQASSNSALDENVSCIQKCPVGQVNADCLSTTISQQDSEALKQLAKLVASQQTTAIEPAALQKLFHIDNDPCDRGTTLLTSSELTNDGKQCSLQESVSDPKLTVKFYVPAHLEGAWELRSLSSLRLRFNGDDKPIISFVKTIGNSPHPLDKEFGGKVLWVESDDSRLMVRTSAPGCVGVKF